MTLMLVVLPNLAVAEVGNTDPIWEIAAEPEWGSSATAGALSAGHGGSHYELIERHHRYGDSAEDFVLYKRYIYTIANAAGLDDASQVSVDFDPLYQRLQMHKVRVLRDTLVINQLHEENTQLLQRETQLEDGLYNGNQTLNLILKDLRVGDRIEISYSLRGRNPVFENRMFGWGSLQASVPVGSYYFQLSYPKHKTVNIKSFGEDVAAVESTIGNRTELTWQNRHVEAVEYQSDVPASFFAGTLVQYSEFTSWTEVARWAEPLYRQSNTTAKNIIEAADHIRLNHSDAAQQLIAAIRLVQDEVRYTGINSGIGGYVADAPSTVLARRFGDCKDKSMLLVALLAELGIPAQPVLVDTDEGAVLPQYLPSPGMFDHMITYIPDFNGTELWIDGTRTLQGGTVETIAQAGFHHALIPAAAERGLVAYSLEELTRPDKEVLEEYRLHEVHDSERGTLTVTSIYRGSFADSVRRWVQSAGRERVASSYEDYYSNRFQELESAEPMTIEDNRETNRLTIVESYWLSPWEESFDHDSDSTRLFTFSVHADSITDSLQLPEDRRRYQPIAQSYPVNIRHRIHVSYALGWNITDESKRVSSKYLNYEYAEKVDDEMLLLDYQLQTLEPEVTVADSRRYIRDLRKVLNDRHYSVNVELDVSELYADALANQLSSVGSWFQRTLESREPADRQIEPIGAR